MSVDDGNINIIGLPVVAQLCQPVEITVGLHSFVYHVLHHVSSVDVDYNQCAESDALLFGQLSSDQCHDVQQLASQYVPVHLQTLPGVADCHLHLGSPVDL